LRRDGEDNIKELDRWDRTSGDNHEPARRMVKTTKGI
jgi:hypothetical protein